MWKVFKSQEKREPRGATVNQENMETKNFEKEFSEPDFSDSERENPEEEAQPTQQEAAADPSYPSESTVDNTHDNENSSDSSEEKVDSGIAEAGSDITSVDKENATFQKEECGNEGSDSVSEPVNIKDVMAELDRLKAEIASLTECRSREREAARREGIVEGRNQQIETQLLETDTLNRVFHDIPSRRISGTSKKSSIFDLANDAR